MPIETPTLVCAATGAAARIASSSGDHDEGEDGRSGHGEVSVDSRGAVRASDSAWVSGHSVIDHWVGLKVVSPAPDARWRLAIAVIGRAGAEEATPLGDLVAGDAERGELHRFMEKVKVTGGTVAFASIACCSVERP